MMRAQVIPALIAALLAEGVEADQVERAVARVGNVGLGRPIDGGNQLWRAFANEQAALLERRST